MPKTDNTIQQKIETAREIVYRENGDMIDPGELDDVLKEHGVEICTAKDDTQTYNQTQSKVIPITACRLAVDERRDPSEFINGTPEQSTFDQSVNSRIEDTLGECDWQKTQHLSRPTGL